LILTALSYGKSGAFMHQQTARVRVMNDVTMAELGNAIRVLEQSGLVAGRDQSRYADFGDFADKVGLPDLARQLLPEDDLNELVPLVSNMAEAGTIAHNRITISPDETTAIVTFAQRFSEHDGEVVHVMYNDTEGGLLPGSRAYVVREIVTIDPDDGGRVDTEWAPAGKAMSSHHEWDAFEHLQRALEGANQATPAPERDAQGPAPSAPRSDFAPG